MENFLILGKIGEGAHGMVFKAKQLQSGEVVALKKVQIRRLEDGVSNTALREIKALQQIDHENVVRLYDVFPHGTGFVLVFEFMLSDLSEVLRNFKNPLSKSQIKSYMIMLLKGISYCHLKKIMHRDLKPANLLISCFGYLKIADFGLARIFQNDPNKRQYSHQVATRWYRAPELLYGSHTYDEGVDLWAIGTIFGEMLNNSPLFPGESDIEQLCCVLHALGTPDEDQWPGLKELPDFNKISFPKNNPIPFEKLVPDASKDAIDLLKKFLVYSSKERIPAEKALLHYYFFTKPLPVHHLELPIPANKVKINRTKLFDVTAPIEESLVSRDQIASLSSFFRRKNKESKLEN
ncbi:cyclin-dependent kinase 20 [Hydra vulgaris]|nr:cyclin-dependent kinase 20 [Hydra vulgaris]